MTSTTALRAATLLLLISLVRGFLSLTPPSDRSSARLHMASRYGPPLGDLGKLNNKEGNDPNGQKKEFKKLVDQVLMASKPEHIPSLLTKHTPLILSLPGNLIMESIEEMLQDQNGDAEREVVSQAIEIVLSFAEEFVEQSKSLDDFHKQLLGKILQTMSGSDGGSDRDREQQLDELLQKEREHFTRGFLKHLDGECQRIASSPKLSKEGIRLQEILRMIKTRIVEELGQELGEGAQVLGQLVAYDDPQERMAVLDAGLTVRGADFAVELRGLTEEALQGFQSVPDEVDPSLVQRVQEIDQRVKSFLEENGEFE